MIVDKLNSDQGLTQEMESNFPYLNNFERLILVTGHRRESFMRGSSVSVKH